MKKQSKKRKSWVFNPKNIKTILIGAAVLVGTMATYYMSGSMFRASILDLAKVPTFDGTHLPLEKTLNWASLTSADFTNFKSGTLTYDTAGSKLINIMTYNSNQLCSNDPAKVTDKNLKNAFLTYITAYLGQYTSGLTSACENAGSHLAVDIRAPKGTPIFAVANGMVSKKSNGTGNGNIVCLTHPNVPSVNDPNTKTTYRSCYLHMDSIASDLSEGAVVMKGQQLGTVGMTGTATTYHLHFQIDKSTAPYSPYWPFTLSEAQSAGMDFFGGVNQGLGKDKATEYSINPLAWVQKYLNYNQTATAGVNDASSSNSTSENKNSSPNTNLNTAAPNPSNNANVNNAGTESNANKNNSTGTMNTNQNVAPPEEDTNENSNATPVTNVDTSAFSDVSSSHKYYTAIMYLKQKGVISGNPDGTFKPNDTLNRAALAKILVEANFKGQAKGGNCFIDVTNQWYAPYVCFAKEKGIVSGYGDGAFKPNNKVSFAEASKMISVSFGFTTGDSPTIPWYKLFVDTLASKNAIPAEVSNFDQAVTRGVFSEIAYRLLTNLSSKESQTFVSLGGIE